MILPRLGAWVDRHVVNVTLVLFAICIVFSTFGIGVGVGTGAARLKSGTSLSVEPLSQVAPSEEGSDVVELATAAAITPQPMSLGAGVPISVSTAQVPQPQNQTLMPTTIAATATQAPTLVPTKKPTTTATTIAAPKPVWYTPKRTGQGPGSDTLVVSGRVLGTDGTPVKGATIMIKWRLNQDWPPPIFAVSDDSGKWQATTFHGADCGYFQKVLNVLMVKSQGDSTSLSDQIELTSLNCGNIGWFSVNFIRK